MTARAARLEDTPSLEDHTPSQNGPPAPVPLPRPAPLPRSSPFLRWRQVYPGREGEVRQVRRWLTGLLPETPARDDVVTVAVELATNAVRHTASGRGGFFAVEVTWFSRPSSVRVAVADGGDPADPADPAAPADPADPAAPAAPRLGTSADSLAERGRGLNVVRALAWRTGLSGDHRGRLMWADMPWTDAGTATAPPGPCAGYEAAIRDGQAALAARHAEVATWFGHATLQWWALTGQAGARQLITAPSAQELARLIDTLHPSAAPGPAAAENAAAGQRPPARLLHHRVQAWPRARSGNAALGAH